MVMAHVRSGGKVNAAYSNLLVGNSPANFHFTSTSGCNYERAKVPVSAKFPRKALFELNSQHLPLHPENPLMVDTNRNDKFFKKVYPILLDMAFESNSQTGRPSTTQALTPSLSFAMLARLPKNMDIIQFFLNLLKLLGQAPFCYDAKRSVYYFTWFSFDTAMSAAMAFTAIFGWFVFISHMVFKKFIVVGPG